MRNYVLDKAVGLLQSFKKKLPPKSSRDVESGLSNCIQIPSTDDKLQDCPGRERSKSTSVERRGDSTQRTNSPSGGAIEQELNQQRHSTVSSSNGPIDQGVSQQPQFTEGPARFIIANDGTKDCMALLVTDTLIANLHDLYEDSHHLSGKEGPLDYARREVRSLENSIDETNELIEVAENEEKFEELQGMLQRREVRLLKVRQRRDELDKGAKQLERNITSSKAHIQWVLDTAMKEADLLEPHKPLTPVTMTDTESNPECHEEAQQRTDKKTGIENQKHDQTQKVTDGVNPPGQHSVIPVNTDDVPEELQLLRREAWESYDDTLVTMHKVQALFDNRQQSYETDLAEYQEGFASGIYDISRSEFDRSKIRYGQKVTRALMDAEEAFEAAKEHAQAVGAIGSDYDATTYYSCYEESWPENQLASYIATKDWGYVHDWLAELPAITPEELDPPELDDWYADEVDPADSISQIDFDECRKDIDRWENIRFDRWEGMRTRVGGPEVQVGFLVRSIETLKRRHSVSLCCDNVEEWEVSA